MKPLFSKNTQAIFYNQHPEPIQRMLDYDWLVGRETPSVVAIVNPSGAGLHRSFFGAEEIIIPVYQTVAEAARRQPQADVLINFASLRSAYSTSLEVMNVKSIRTVFITAEGMPENETRELIRLAKKNGKWIIGPATVGAIKPGEFRIANTGGTIENIMDSKLYRPGSVGIVTVSGGFSNEMYNLVSKFADGTYEGIAVGGDKFAGSTLAENMLRLEAEPGVKMLLLLGEIGGNAEYEVVKAMKNGKIKKPVIAWVAGTVAKLFPTEVQFGHAGAKSGTEMESAQAKNKALKDAGAYVPSSFNDFGKLVAKVFKEKVANQKNYKAPSDDNFRMPPLDYKEAIKAGKVRRSSTVLSSISDDRDAEPTYNKKEITYYANKPLGHTINALWFHGKLNKTGEEFIELCLKLTADHGPAVATAHNAIVAARAGKDVVTSVISGLATIGPRHGGAIDEAAVWALDAVERGIDAYTLVKEKKQKGELVMGIGHRIRTAQNPDTRVTTLKNFAKKNLKKTTYLDYALTVEAETLKKKNNLILNVDGAVGTIFLDILVAAGYSQEEIKEVVTAGTLNAIFVLGRTIGMIGHILDQKRLREGLYRHPWDDILYM